jgi:hypothetical protein
MKLVIHNAADITKHIDAIREIGFPLELEYKKHRATRSNSQNKYYWRVVIKMIAEETGNEENDVHDFLRGRFIGKEEKKHYVLDAENPRIKHEVTEYVPMTTTDLNTVEFENYLTRCREWASEWANIFIPQPNEVIPV